MTTICSHELRKVYSNKNFQLSWLNLQFISYGKINSFKDKKYIFFGYLVPKKYFWNIKRLKISVKTCYFLHFPSSVHCLLISLSTFCNKKLARKIAIKSLLKFAFQLNWWISVFEAIEKAAPLSENEDDLYTNNSREAEEFFLDRFKSYLNNLEVREVLIETENFYRHH